jgi:hypothetical protein
MYKWLKKNIWDKFNNQKFSNKILKFKIKPEE